MRPIQIKLPAWDSVQYNTFSRSDIANYQATTSVLPTSSIEVLKDSILLITTIDSFGQNNLQKEVIKTWIETIDVCVDYVDLDQD